MNKMTNRFYSEDRKNLATTSQETTLLTCPVENIFDGQELPYYQLQQKQLRPDKTVVLRLAAKTKRTSPVLSHFLRTYES